MLKPSGKTRNSGAQEDERNEHQFLRIKDEDLSVTASCFPLEVALRDRMAE